MVHQKRNYREEIILFSLKLLKKSNNTKKITFAKHLKFLVVRIHFDSVRLLLVPLLVFYSMADWYKSYESFGAINI